jgi:hypothetical protein
MIRFDLVRLGHDLMVVCEIEHDVNTKKWSTRKDDHPATWQGLQGWVHL